MRGRLVKRGASESEVEETIERLFALRYLDDRRFAQVRADSLHRRGRGSRRAHADLHRYGVANDIADEAVHTAFADESELARMVMKRRFRSAPETTAERARIARFLHGRGFPQDIVLAIVHEGC